MEKKQIKQIEEIRELYKAGLELKKQELEKLYSKRAQRYRKTMDLEDPKIQQDEEIMMAILENFEIAEDNIYINNGFGIQFDEDTLFESTHYIRKEDVPAIRGRYIDPNKNVSIVHMTYNLCAGSLGYYLPNDSKLITLPYLTKIIDGISPYSSEISIRTNPVFQKHREIFRDDVIRAQFFMKLAAEDYQDVYDYYVNKDNWESINNDMEAYFMRRKKELTKARKF